ncbi:MAG: hypothetical protein SFW08_08105 [Gemmatimonadaceae bacterium]|nr:hypothetical protein [Gemmatimonadaceae bacterium]
MMRTQTPPPPTEAPRVPQVSVPGVNGGAPQALPMTAEQIARLRQKGRELSSQLGSVSRRREEVLGKLKDADAAAKPGLDARLKVLDARLVSLEQQIEENSRMIANAPLEVEQAAEEVSKVGPFGIRQEVYGIGTVGACLLLAPIALAYARMLWRRGTNPRPPKDAAAEARAVRMEQAIDAMSIELERISEGQRFVTKLMSERALGAGQAPMEPIVQRDAVAQERT